MKLIRFNLPTLRLVRLLFAVCVSTLLIFSSAFPAFADASGDQPKKGGEANLLGIEHKAGDIAREPPMSLEKTQAEANQGLNEIQGAADADKMKNPENSSAPSVEGNVQGKLEKAINKLQGKG